MHARWRWQSRNVPSMDRLADEIRENVETALKLGATDVQVSLICTSPIGESRVDWDIRMAYEYPDASPPKTRSR